MNGAPPVSSEVLAEIHRGPKARVVVARDVWEDGTKSVNLGVYRSAVDGHWTRRRSVTLYATDIPDVIAALERAREILT